MITIDDIKGLSDGNKVILLMEVAPLTDKFAQIMLTQAEFAAMRQGLWTALPLGNGGPDTRCINTRTSAYNDISLPNIPALYSAEEKARDDL